MSIYLISICLIIINIIKCTFNSDVIVYPRITDENGFFLNNENFSQIAKKFKNLNVVIELDKQNYTITLQSNLNLIKNNFNHFINDYTCHFVGSIKNKSNSYSAISLCENSLKGLIYLNDSLYSIDSFNDNSNTNAHKIKFIRQYKLQFSKRLKRSLVKERYVETLIVADRSMKEYYEYIDLENYLLTIMNMVNSLFYEPSVGNLINIRVARIIILEDDNAFEVAANATYLLEKFSEYQYSINYPEDHPAHHDYAILVTKVDICLKSESCDTLGLTRLGLICNPMHSCSVNEDRGLSLALTIAHELGHSFNAEHDTEDLGCIESDIDPYLMKSHLVMSSMNFIWSECSRNSITKFLDSADLTCLDDDVNLDLASNDKERQILPGVIYDFDEQCRFAFGINATHCKNKVKNECAEVWCKLNDQVSCITKGEKAAEGTLCEDYLHFWCQESECIPIELQNTVNGEWSEWTPWSKCNRDCNGGVRFKERYCSNPKPSNNGRYCIGDRVRYEICNTQTCNNYEQSDLDFKNFQCNKYTQVTADRDLQWEYYFIEREPCKLYCKPSNDTYYKLINNYAENGTPCSTNSEINKICLNGICRNVGCDWKFDSTSKFDFCGSCGGDNSTCNIFDGRIEFSTFKVGSYEPVLIIQKGAVSVKISENSFYHNSNFLAIRDFDGNYYLNGDFKISPAGSYEFQDFVFEYEMSSIEETIVIKGQLKKDIYIMLLNMQYKSNISYYYGFPNNFKPNLQFHYKWIYEHEWSVCSKSCGKGIKTLMPMCVEQILGHVDDSFCQVNLKPEALIEPCNVFECQADWIVSEWQECSSTCFNGSTGLMKRSVICVIQKPNLLNEDIEIIGLEDSYCDLNKKPESFKRCEVDLEMCHNESFIGHYWITEEWSKECEIDLCATETRVVKCNDLNGICDLNKRPISERKCNLPKHITCGKWETSSWSRCNVKECDTVGYRTREVKCLNGTLCSVLKIPHLNETCTIQCPTNFNLDYDKESIYADIVLTFNNSKSKPILNSSLLYNNQHNILNSTKPVEENNETSRTIFGKNFNLTTIENLTLRIPTRISSIESTSSNYKIENTTTAYLINSPEVKNSTTIYSTIKPNKTTKIVSSKRPKITKLIPKQNTTSRAYLTISKKPLLTTLKPSTNIKKNQIKANQTKRIIRNLNNLVNNTDYYDIIADIEILLNHVKNESINSIDYEYNFLNVSDYDNYPLEYDWFTGEYGPCSKNCGTGYKSRKVICRSKTTYEEVDDMKCLTPRPQGYEECNSNECNDWVVSEWSECSRTCGTGFQTREAACNSINDDLCDQDQYPLLRRACFIKPCFEWQTDPWDECSKTCGPGLQTRRVYCLNHITNSTSDLCNLNSMPKTLQKCVILEECPITTTTEFIDLNCQDLFSKKLCTLVLFSNKCSDNYFGKLKCCQTCKKEISELKLNSNVN